MRCLERPRCGVGDLCEDCAADEMEQRQMFADEEYELDRAEDRMISWQMGEQR